MGRLRATIRRIWGFDRLRPLQEQAMQAALAGRDVLLVLPTGGGKSLCYQAPALLRSRPTVVLSPLISLMKDQVDGLRQNGVGAAMVSSAQDAEERAEALRAYREGHLALLYAAPERLFQKGFVHLLQEHPPAALVVDEAHCISHWGHDFRPEYRRIGELRKGLGGVPVTACTATATPRVCHDIHDQLRLREPEVLVGPFDRPNLTYRFIPRRERLRQVLEVLERHPREAGIVYALRRSDVDQIAAALVSKGLRARPYHAGLPDEERRSNQEAFLEERCDLIVGTVAFGMGIDRPDVRFVVHAAMPKSLEHYLQESGRAGRDGLAAECVLLYGGADYQGWRTLIQQGGEHEDTGPALRRLSEMYRVAAGTLCRHRLLAGYFGQELPARPCGACDVCLEEVPALPEATVVAQKILSCVHRLEESYGAGHVTDVLRGARTEKIRRMGHDALSTYGLLRDLDTGAVRGALDQLVAQGCLQVSPGSYPVLGLTARAAEVLRGDREVRLLAPPRPGGPGPATRTTGRPSRRDLVPAELRLFEGLRALRTRLARERGVPPYLIFADRVLIQMARERPQDLQGLRRLKGMGELKARELGPAFLQVLRGAGAEPAGRTEGPFC